MLVTIYDSFLLLNIFRAVSDANRFQKRKLRGPANVLKGIHTAHPSDD
jgi:hypothetical protein